MGYSRTAVTGRRFRKERVSSISKGCMIFLCTLLVILVLGRSISKWLLSFPRVDSSFGKCENFRDPLRLKHDSLGLLPEGEKYIWYYPAAGFSNQARALKNALKIAMLLNRTLILPPITDHGEVSYGSKCLQPGYSNSKRSNNSWSAVRDHFLKHRYVSIADVVDLRPLSPHIVRTIDLRVFLALWCGLDVRGVCTGPKCRNLAASLSPNWGSIDICTQRFLPTSDSCLVYEVKDDCSTTIWTRGENPVIRYNLEQQLMEELAHDPEITASFVPRRTIKRKNILKTLGPSSEAADFFLISFASLFSTMYKNFQIHVDIRAAVGDQVTARKLQAIQGSHAFTKEIMNGAKTLVEEIFPNRQFFCAHARLGDGLFAMNWNQTFAPLSKKLEKMSKSFKGNQKLKVFLMTDLGRESWNGTILAGIERDKRFQVHNLDRYGDFIIQTAKQMMATENGFRLGFVPRLSQPDKPLNSTSVPSFFPDVRLYLEEVICACAKLGFLGTRRSSASRNIKDLRNSNICPVI
ncbi:hypothetical protein R1sor_008119 [Riccia sorocarpa]|uniref:O-fucosyltransferase family protein n=1 Tax=Riccia sorocarpa TaxID=122646 RepID=A0ABD3HSP2_9MARC